MKTQMKRSRNCQPRLCALFGVALGVLFGLLLLFGGFQAASADAPTIHSFNGGDGIGPTGPLVQGRDGNFYGTTAYGYGNPELGSVFKLTPAGVLTTLANFIDSDAHYPAATPGPLILGDDGNFYGTTIQGGSSEVGTVFKVTTDGTPAGTTITILVSFNRTNGGYPNAPLIQASDGSFYGITGGGASNNSNGTIFRVTTNGTSAGTTLTTLVPFNNGKGEFPTSPLLQGHDGNFYGTLYGLSNSGDSTVFKMTTDGTAAGTTLTPLVSGNVGNFEAPLAALIQASDGNFYGTSPDGGSSGDGIVFKVTTNGTEAGSKLTTLVNFNHPNGEHPFAALFQGDDGNFYGTTKNGGSSNFGTVFKLTSDGTPAGSKMTPLVNFNKSNGEEPVNSLTQGNDGKFYGTTPQGGMGFGTVFAIDPRAIQSVRFTPMTLTGGKTAMGEVTLSHVADSDQLVTLTSSNPAVLPIRASVTITTGHRHALFTVTAKPVTKTTIVTITATLNGVSSYSAVRVTP